MADLTTNLEQIETAQAQKEVTANALFDAMSPGSYGGRHAEACGGLIWGYYGGRWAGSLNPNGTLTLSASVVTYIVANRLTGEISLADGSPSEWFETGTYGRLYKVTTGASTVTDFEDHRAGDGGLFQFGGSMVSGASIQIVDAAGNFGSPSPTLEIALAELAMRIDDLPLGVQQFTEAVSVASPNATVPVVSFMALNGATNVDAAFIPKGSGAVLADVPDGTAAGGDKRGTNAVDWQTKRASETQVANGASATVSGGENNSAQGTYSATGGGLGNLPSGVAACIPGGRDNTAAGDYSIATGRNASTRGIAGAAAHSSEVIAVHGDAQEMRLVLKWESTGAATEPMVSQGAGTLDTSNQLTLPNNSAYAVKGLVVARQNTTGDTKSWEFIAHIRRGASAASTALVAAATVTVIANDAGAAAWTLAVAANTTQGALRFDVTGETAKTIRWVCSLTSAQVVS